MPVIAMPVAKPAMRTSCTRPGPKPRVSARPMVPESAGARTSTRTIAPVLLAMKSTPIAPGLPAPTSTAKSMR